MAYENSICFISITSFKHLKIFFVFINSSNASAVNLKSRLCCESDKVHKPLEHMVDFFILYIVYKKKMKFVIIVDKAFVIIIKLNSFLLLVKDFPKLFDSSLTFWCIIFISKALCAEALYGTSYLDSFLHILLT